MPIALTVGLGKFIAGLRYEDIPKDAIPVIHTGFTGLRRRHDRRARRTPGAAAQGGARAAPGRSDAALRRRHGPGARAAWINGTAAHALDFDDVAQRGHPTPCWCRRSWPRRRRSAQPAGRWRSRTRAGYETWAELVRRDADGHHNKGWHPTGIFGAIGAAAACASLRGLSAEQAAHAIALGASQSAGIMANFGTMTKPFHAGRAAHAGVISARLAASGFTAALDALEQPAGFPRCGVSCRAHRP